MYLKGVLSTIGKFGNKSAVLIVASDYGCSFKQLEPLEGTPTNKRLNPREVVLDDVDSLLAK